jgi:hypothetical protein
MVDVGQIKEWLAKKDETPRLEFKLKYVLAGPGNSKHKDELGKDIIALANTAGRTQNDVAHLLVGAGDKLKSDGTRDREDVRSSGYSRKTFLDIVNARSSPPLPDLNYSEVEVDGNYYGVIEVPPSPFLHELSRDLVATSGSWRKGMVPIRRGDEVAAATYQEMQLLKAAKERWNKPTPTVLEELEEYLTDPTKMTKARGLVIKDARKLYGVLNDPTFLKKDEDQRYASIVERMKEYEVLVEPLIELFTAGSYGGGEWLRSVWPEALSIISNPVETPRGAESLMRLRRYPALLLLYAGGVAAVAGKNYANLTALLRETQVNTYGPSKSVSSGLVPGRVVSSYDEQHLAEKGKHRMPFNSHIVNVLRPTLSKYVHNDDQYMVHFVRFEYLYALVSEAQGNGLIVGSFSWESEQYRGLRSFSSTNVWIVGETEEELDRLGTDWPPLKSALFDGPLEKFREFKNKVDLKVSKSASDFFRH